MNAAPTAFVHRFEPGTQDRRSLLLLHGTGGDERDLLPLGRAIAPGAALLSPRGAVLERGMPRFFRRLADGVFDENDLRRRAADLDDFIRQACLAYDLAAPIAVGFSNGANMAAALMLTYPDALAAAVLIRAMPPFDPPPHVDLKGKPVLLLSGGADPLVPAATAARLARTLMNAAARSQPFHFAGRSRTLGGGRTARNGLARGRRQPPIARLMPTRPAPLR